MSNDVSPKEILLGMSLGAIGEDAETGRKLGAVRATQIKSRVRP